MKKKLIVGAVALGLGLTSFGAGSASAAPGDGGKCARNGVAFLRDNGLLVDVAQNGFAGLSLGQVVKLHTQSPQTFADGAFFGFTHCEGLSRP